MNWSLFFDVFNLTAVLYAIAAGIGFGSTVLLYISLKFPAKTLLSPIRTGLLAAGASALAGTLFFAGQIVQAIATDPSWPRALARAALWELFAVGIGAGLGVAASFAHPRETS